MACLRKPIVMLLTVLLLATSVVAFKHCARRNYGRLVGTFLLCLVGFLVGVTFVFVVCFVRFEIVDLCCLENGFLSFNQIQFHLINTNTNIFIFFIFRYVVSTKCDARDNQNKTIFLFVPIFSFLPPVAFFFFKKKSCELFMGDQYEGVFEPKDPDSRNYEELSGKPFTITITQDSFAIVASERSTVYAQFKQSDNRMFINVTDHYAVPTHHGSFALFLFYLYFYYWFSPLGCPANEVGQYELRFIDHTGLCRVAKLFRIKEQCGMRSRLWGSELTLLKKPCRGPSDGICSIQERTVWVNEKKHDTRSWFVFGGNDAYVETSISFPNVRTQYFGRVSVNDKSFHSRSSSSEASSTSSSLTFDDSLLAFTEYASYPPGRQCTLLEGTGFYRYVCLFDM
jgi:hypothetical protein